MVTDIAAMRLNAVKFHLLLNVDSYMQKNHPLKEKTKKWIFTKEQWKQIIEYANQNGLDVIALCDDVESVRFLIDDSINVNSIEIHASGLNDIFLLKALEGFKKRVILGVGGSEIHEIHSAIKELHGIGINDILLMYGFQSYPTDYKQINLAKMILFQRIFNLPIGYADHTAFDDPHNAFISVLAAAMGFNILEKHYTPEFGKERIDYHAAVGMDVMKKIQDLMTIALSVYGSETLDMSIAEKNYGNVGPMKKAIVARRNIKAGEILKEEDMWFKRTAEESFMSQLDIKKLVNLQASKDLAEDEVIDFSKVKYQFKKVDASSFINIREKK
ncbi:MAG: N-acetylneuraminate synthase family protein [Candidatus Sigynarchaeota archaeon]